MLDIQALRYQPPTLAERVAAGASGQASYEPRTVWIAETTSALAKLLGEAFEVDLSLRFWERWLLPYTWTAYKRFGPQVRDPRREPPPFKPLDGQRSPDALTVARQVGEETAKSLRARQNLRWVDLAAFAHTRRLLLGFHRFNVGSDLAATPVTFRWMQSGLRSEPRVRQRVEQLVAAHTDDRLLLSARALPMVYVEYFRSALAVCGALTGRGIEAVFYEHVYSAFDRLLIALLSHEGAAVCHLQTGATVGETRRSVAPEARAQYDCLLTYGWKSGSQDVPFYAVRLEEFAERYRRSASGERRGALVVFNALRDRRLREHYQSCVSELSEAGVHGRFPLTLRPRLTTRRLPIGNDGAGELQAHGLVPPGSVIDNGRRPMAELVASAEIVIHLTHPSTGFLECLFVDHPVVALWSEVRGSETELTDVAAPFYDFFVREGLLHRSPASLGRFLANLDVARWWAGVRSTPELAAFKREFARSREERHAQR
jgi:hypothetical protein